MKTITPKEMKRVEQAVMQAGLATGERLMHNAARAVVDAVVRWSAGDAGATAQASGGGASSISQSGHIGALSPALIWCVCGTGNNGGDGLAAAWMLAKLGVACVCDVLPGTLSPDATRERDTLLAVKASGAPVTLRMLASGEVPKKPQGATLVIDALFGTGLDRPLSGDGLAAANAINQAALPVIAVDIPSGLHGETGEAFPCAVRASETVTFHRPKTGLYLRDGADFAGDVTVADIGIPAERDDADGLDMATLADVRAWLSPRKRSAHKGDFGRVAIWAGSEGMAGAAAICALATLRAGAGLVTVVCPPSVLPIVQVLCPCATCTTDRRAAFERADVIAIGCGLGTGDAMKSELMQALREIAKWNEISADGASESVSSENESAQGFAGFANGINEQFPQGMRDMSANGAFSGVAVSSENESAQGFAGLRGKRKFLVLDADALNLLSAMPDARLPQPCILTPHPAEAARLLAGEGFALRDILREPVQAARALRQRYGASVILKGARSVLAGERLAINPFGTPAMAKGGSGDALTGIVAALAANAICGALPALTTETRLMQAACALHGLAGERAASKVGERALLATDLVAQLGMATEAGDSCGAADRRAAGSSALSEAANAATLHVDDGGFPSSAASVDDATASAANAAPSSAPSPIGRAATVTVEHPLGFRETAQAKPWRVNHGHVQEVLLEQNEWQDAYLIGVSEPCEWMQGVVVGTLTQADGGIIWLIAERARAYTSAELQAILGELADGGTLRGNV